MEKANPVKEKQIKDKTHGTSLGALQQQGKRHLKINVNASVIISRLSHLVRITRSWRSTLQLDGCARRLV